MADPLPPRPLGRSDLFYQEVRDGGVLFDAKGDKVYVLNGCAAFIWNCCDGEHSLEAIVEELTEALGAQAPTAATLRKDAERSLREFQEQGLLSPA